MSIKDDKLPDGIDLNDPYFREEMGNLAAPAAGSKADKKKKKGRRMEEDAADKQEQVRSMEYPAGCQGVFLTPWSMENTNFGGKRTLSLGQNF